MQVKRRLAKVSHLMPTIYCKKSITANDKTFSNENTELTLNQRVILRAI